MLFRAVFETRLGKQQGQNEWETFKVISTEWCPESCEVGALFVEWYVQVPLLCVESGKELSAI